MTILTNTVVVELSLSRGTVSTTQAAKLLGVARGTVQRLVDIGKLEAIKTPGGHRKIALQSIERMLGHVIENSESDDATFINSKSNENILIVEDSIFYSRYLEEIVRQIFDEPTINHCFDGYDAYHQICTKKFSLIILDINIPEMDGVSLIKKISQIYPEYIKKITIITEMDLEVVKQKISNFNDMRVISKKNSTEFITSCIKEFYLNKDKTND